MSEGKFYSLFLDFFFILCMCIFFNFSLLSFHCLFKIVSSCIVLTTTTMMMIEIESSVFVGDDGCLMKSLTLDFCNVFSYFSHIEYIVENVWYGCYRVPCAFSLPYTYTLYLFIPYLYK